MAKTRANAKTSAPPAKLNNKFVAKPKKNNKKKSASKTKQTEPQSKVKSPLTAVQLQSKSDKAKIVNHPTVEELLKLCCPVSIRLTRIEPNQSKENSDVKSKCFSDFECIVFVSFICVFKSIKKTRNLFIIIFSIFRFSLSHKCADRTTQRI